jgi:thiol-disulfide isomerase/thioredoxin
MMSIWGRRLALLGAVLLAACGCGTRDADPAEKIETGPPPAQAPATDARIDWLRREAHSTIRRGDMETGRERLEALLQRLPEDREALFLLGAIQLDESARMAADRPAEADARLALAAETLRKLRKAHPELRPDEREMLANALFLDARRLAKAGQADEAFDRLEEAEHAGFANPEAVTAGAEFKPLRDHAGYDDLIGRITAHADAAAQDAAREALGENLSIPFNFKLPDLDGNLVTRAQVQGTAVTIVDVWGTWCPPCRMEVPHLAKLYETYRDRGLAVVGLNFENADTPAEAAGLVRKAVSDLKIPYPCLLGDKSMERSIPGFGPFPITFFLDREGRVRARLAGARPYRELEAIADALISEANLAPPRAR